MVVINVERNNGLYEMIGNTYLVQGRGDDNLIAEKDNTCLWHARLGHMSIKGLQILSK